MADSLACLGSKKDSGPPHVLNGITSLRGLQYIEEWSLRIRQVQCLTS